MQSSTPVMFIATSANAEHGRGGRRRVVDVTHQARLHGFAPMILCFLPFEQVLRGPRFWCSGKASLSDEADCPVVYAPMLPLTRFRFMERLNMLWTGFLCYLFSFRFRSRLFYGHGIRAAEIALVARSLRKHARVVVDVHGVGSAEFAQKESLSLEHPRVRHLQSGEQRVLSGADQVVFVSERMRIYFKEVLNNDFANAQVIPCAVAVDDSLAEFEARDNLRAKLGLNERFVISYAGSAVPYQQPRQMVALFNQIHQHMPSAFFLILTHSTEIFEDYLTKLSTSPQDYLVTALPHEQVLPWLQAADVGLLLRDDSLLNQVSSPTKFAEYLKAGLPVLLTLSAGDYAQIAQRENLGYLLDPNNLEVNQPLLEFLNQVREDRKAYAQRCRTYALQNLSWDHYGKQLAQLLEEIAAKSSDNKNSR